VEIQSKLSMVALGDNDVPKWVVSKSGTYSSVDTWEALRDSHHPDVEWWQMVRFLQQFQSMHSFCGWLYAAYAYCLVGVKGRPNVCYVR
jgi:hypothetical protein